MLELLIVMFVMVLLMSLIVGVGKLIHEKAARQQTLSTIEICRNAYDAINERYKNDGLTMPPPTPGLKELITDTTYGAVGKDRLSGLPTEAYDSNHNIVDAYGYPLKFSTGGLGGQPVIYSIGPDGQDGTTDDIRPDR